MLSWSNSSSPSTAPFQALFLTLFHPMSDTPATTTLSPEESTSLPSSGSNSSSQTSNESPLEHLLSLPVEEMDLMTLRQHVQSLRELRSSPVKRRNLLIDESVHITTKKKRAKKTVDTAKLLDMI